LHKSIVDYDKTTAPTARLESLRLILHIAASLNWDIHQFDIKTAFVLGILSDDETMYLGQPPGCEVEGKEDWVMKLFKRMKQASRVWNQTFNRAAENWDFIRFPCEYWCVYSSLTSMTSLLFPLPLTRATDSENS
jgi:hypothetical protein